METSGKVVNQVYDLLEYDAVNLGPRDFDDGYRTLQNITMGVLTETSFCFT